MASNIASGKPPSYPRLILVSLALMVLCGAIILVLDWKQATQLIGNADWRFFAVAFGFVTLAYACSSGSMVVMMRIFGVEVDQTYLLKVGLVSSVLSNLIALPAALWLKLLLLGRHGVSNSQTVGASLLLSYFKNLVFYALIPVSLVYVAFSYSLVFGGAVIITLIIIVLLIFMIGATVIVLHRRMREFVLRLVGRGWRFVTHRNIQPSLNQFESTLTEGLGRLEKRRDLRLPLAAFVVGDVAATIIALWFCFKALAVPVHLGVLITGFNFGITLTVISLIPGDIGVQEASMAGVFALFGVPFSHGVLVAILFRVLYYLLPFVLSLGFYWGLIRDVQKN
jgi:uncharacterized protein (TIRG00374 family)